MTFYVNPSAIYSSRVVHRDGFRHLRCPPNKSSHNSQRDIRCEAEYDDRNLVLCEVLKTRTGQVGSFQPKHSAMYPEYRPTHRHHHDRRNEQQYEIDCSCPTEKCSNCF